MKKMISGLSFFFVFMLSIQNVYSTQDRFEHRIELDDTKGVIAVQHYKNAPYPSPEIPFGEEVFNSATGTLEIEGKTHSTRFFGGWFFIDLNEENLASAPLILNTLMNFGKKAETPFLQTIANASCQLRETCEKQNLQNPYAGRNLHANYCNEGGIPLAEHFVPTATPLDSGAIRLVRSLTAVYGGILDANDNNALKFKHGIHSVFSYDDKMISAYSDDATFLKGSFRETDDGVTANQSLRITSFESWFE